MARRKPQIAKVDGNQNLIVNELRALGCSVTSLAKVASGAPDIVVGFAGVNVLFEIKRVRNLKGEPEQLTPDEVEWHSTWRGQCAVITDSKQAVEIIEAQLNKMGVRHVSLAHFAHRYL